MRKVISLVLSIMLIVSLAVPAFASAEVTSSTEVKASEGSNSELEEVLKAVRRKFDIPESLKFESYSVSEWDGEKVWYLYWRDKEKDTSISINITADGIIKNYSYYEPYDYPSGVKLPKIEEEDALEIAKSFIRFVAPEGTLMEIEKQDVYQNPLSNRYYYFNFYRSVNGVPYYSNNIYIMIDSETGKVTHYNYNMERDLVFPDPKQAISLAEGEKAYAEQLGLKLVYQYNYDYNKKELYIYPAYIPKYSNSIYAIDAITGEKIRITYPYIRIAYDGTAAESAMMDVNLKSAAGAAGEPVLTPEELEAVKKQLNLFTEKDAERIARETPEIGLDESFLLRSWNLNKKWPMQDEYVYYLYFVKEVGEETEASIPPEKAAIMAAAGVDIETYKRIFYANVSIDAQTGEILSFNNSALNNTDAKKQPEFNEEEAKAAVEEFLKNFIGEKFDQVEYQEPEEDYIIYRTAAETEPERYFSFNYTRKVNDILFPGNNIYVSFDAVTGKVTSFSMTWFNVDFPAIDNVITLEEANKALFENIGLELQYQKIVRPSDYPIPLSNVKEVSVVEAKAESIRAEIVDLPVSAVTDVVDGANVESNAEDAVGVEKTAEKGATDEVERAVEIDASGATAAADAATDGAIETGETSRPADVDTRIYPPPVIPKYDYEVKLVYVLKSGRPYILDAYTGNVIGYDGKPYKEDKPAEYTDLDGHFAEKQIKLLAKYRIIDFAGPEFKPGEKVTQKEFLMILSKILDRYYIPYITEDSTQEEIDEMYKQLIRRGIVKEGEKDPDAIITRENAVKFIIRVLNYEKVANIRGIFIVPFEDAEDIAPELEGYVAIAAGLKIVSGSGGKFNPKKELTRAEAAVMIYNCLALN